MKQPRRALVSLSVVYDASKVSPEDLETELAKHIGGSWPPADRLGILGQVCPVGVDVCEQTCRVCGAELDPNTDYYYQGEYVCPACWDERLAGDA